jgi:hypothetical protein
MANVVVGQLVGIPTPIAATIGVAEVTVLAGLASIVAERIFFRMPRD